MPGCGHYNTNRQGLQSVPTEVRKNKHGESVKKFMIFQTICSLEKVCWNRYIQQRIGTWNVGNTAWMRGGDNRRRNRM